MNRLPSIITVSLNPAIDRVIEVDDSLGEAHPSAREVTRAPAGKGINVSRALAALGVPSIATGFLGEESLPVFAPVFADGLIRNEFILLSGCTRENFTIAGRGMGGLPLCVSPMRRRAVSAPPSPDIHLRMKGLPVGRQGLAALRRKLRRLIESADQGAMPLRFFVEGHVAPSTCPPADNACGHATQNHPPIVILTGSLPPGVSPREFAGLADLCLRARARVAVDTSGPALRAVAARRPADGRKLWLIKPNEEELSQWAGKPPKGRAGMIAAARRLAERFENVILSLGRAGACLFTDGGRLAIAAAARVDPAKVRSTVGCGDALLAGYVGGLAKGLPAREAFHRAVALASASALSSAPASPRMAEASRLLRTIRVKDL